MESSGHKAPAGKFIVIHGIHARTLMSRDCGEPIIYDSKEEARREFAKAKAGYARLGYVTWFAHMYDDQGNRTMLDTPVPYK